MDSPAAGSAAAWRPTAAGALPSAACGPTRPTVPLLEPEEMVGDASEHDPAAVLEELVSFVQDQLQVRAGCGFEEHPVPALAAEHARAPAQVLSYKWVARRYAMPANLAKRCAGRDRRGPDGWQRSSASQHPSTPPAPRLLHTQLTTNQPHCPLWQFSHRAALASDWSDTGPARAADPSLPSPPYAASSLSSPRSKATRSARSTCYPAGANRTRPSQPCTRCSSWTPTSLRVCCCR